MKMVKSRLSNGFSGNNFPRLMRIATKGPRDGCGGGGNPMVRVSPPPIHVYHRSALNSQGSPPAYSILSI